MLGTLAAKLMTDESKQNRDNRKTRLEKARAMATDFYVAINSATDSCHIVLQEPDGEVMLLLGGRLTMRPQRK